MIVYTTTQFKTMVCFRTADCELFPTLPFRKVVVTELSVPSLALNVKIQVFLKTNLKIEYYFVIYNI